MIRLQKVTKIYKTKAKSEVKALSNVSFHFESTGLVFILGASGSGKTTLLNMIGGLDTPTEGRIIVDENKVLGKDLSLEQYRQNYIGFVFQEYNLLDELNVFDNVSLAVTYSSKRERKIAVDAVLKKVGLTGYEKRRIGELSGGQKQRIAIARALAKNSRVLLCDEPTGNLDSQTGKEIFDLLSVIAKEKLVIVVSHNEEMALKYADRVIKITDGAIADDNVRNTVTGTERKESNLKHNRVSLGYKVKCGFYNLCLHKFKTSISFLLLFLSVFTMCVMQICLSYNAEQTITDSIAAQHSFIVLKNNSKNGDASNIAESYPLADEVERTIGQEAYADGYKLNYGTAFLLNERNMNLLEHKDFYFRENLTEQTAYVTDYFVDIVMKNSDFSALSFTSYSILNGQKVIYKGHTLFTIAGIIKTDYKEYFDERGNIRSKPESYENSMYYEREVNYKQKYEYQAIYMTDTTFEEMYIDNGSIYFSSDSGYSIQGTEGNYTTSLKNIGIINIETQNPMFYTETGLFGVHDLNESKEEGTEQRKLSSNEVVISGDLYNRIFGESVDWEEFSRLYRLGIFTEEPLQNALPHLNKTISVTVDNGKERLEIKNKKVVGVSTEYAIEKEEYYTVYGTKAATGLTNRLLSKHFVSLINPEKLSDAYKTLHALRGESVLVGGTAASLVYEKEYIIRQMSYFLIGVAAVISVIAVISIFNLVNAKIKDKKKEIGILSAIGLKKSEINFIYLFSIFCMTVMAILLTVGGLYFVTYLVNTLLMQVPFGYISYFSVRGLTYLVIGATGVLLFLVSLYPLIRMTRQKPVDIIRN